MLEKFLPFAGQSVCSHYSFLSCAIIQLIEKEINSVRKSESDFFAVIYEQVQGGSQIRMLGNLRGLFCREIYHTIILEF